MRGRRERRLSRASDDAVHTLSDLAKAKLRKQFTDLQSRTRLEKALRLIFAVQRIWRAWTHLRHRRIEACRPQHFTVKDGSPANYGSIVFEKHGVREPAPFVRLGDDSDMDKVVGLVTNVWNVKSARVVISLTGGAQDLHLKPHVHDVINRGLVRAAQQTNAWIVTGGTDTGVMKLVGEAVRDYQADVPCIGVATWGVVHGREQLETSRGKEEFYRKIHRNDQSGAVLQPNHTHFLLVDTGKEGARAWGGEIQFRMAFEQRYCDRYKVPMVLVVIGGGVGTLKTISKAVQQRVPVVLIADSGGAPATIAHYMRTGEHVVDARGERGVKPAKEDAADPARLKLWKQETRRLVEQLVDVDRHAKVLNLFSTRPGGDEHSKLDLVLLTAMLFDTEGNLRQSDIAESGQMLQLAIEWGRREIVQQWMEKSAGLRIASIRHTEYASTAEEEDSSERRSISAPAETWKAQAIIEQALRDALLLALRRHKPDIVHLLLQQDVRPSEVDILELWKVVDMRNFEVKTDLLSRGMRQWEEETLSTAARQLARTVDQVSVSSFGGESHRSGIIASLATVLAADRWRKTASQPRQLSRSNSDAGRSGLISRASSTDSVQATDSAGGGDDRRSHRHRQLHLYRKYVVRWIATEFDLRELQLWWDAKQPRCWRVEDIFYWAVLNPTADENLVHVLWRHVDEPIRMALVASHLTAGLGRVARFGSTQFDRLALLYESWAVGVLDQCANELEARWLLQVPFREWPDDRRGGTLMHLAIQRQRKAFISHAHAQSLLDAWWRGDNVDQYDGVRRRGVTCFGSDEPHFVLVLLHALTGTVFGIVNMEPTLAVKFHAARKHHSRKAGVNGEARALGLGVRGAALAPAPHDLRSGGQHSVPPGHNMFAFETWRDIDVARSSWSERAYDFFTAPYTKFVLRTASYLLFLTLYAVVLIYDDGTPDFSMWEIIFFAWALSHAVDEVHQLWTTVAAGESHFDDEVWNYLDALMFWVIFPVVIGLRVVALFICCDQPETSIDVDENGDYIAGDCSCSPCVYARLCLAVNALFCFTRFLANYRVHKRLGVLIYVINTMFRDIRTFVYILSVVLFGFAFAFGGIAPPRRLQVHADSSSPFLLPLWDLFDLSDLNDVTNAERSASPALGIVLLGFYLFMSQILLVNLLIAMMNTSFATANQNATEEWAASRASSIMELRLLLASPPPFTLPYLLCNVLLAGLKRLIRACGSDNNTHGEVTMPPEETDVSMAKRRRNLNFLHDFLDQEAQRKASGIDSQVRKLREDLDRIASLVEAAASDRADSRLILDRLEERMDQVAGHAPAAASARGRRLSIFPGGSEASTHVGRRLQALPAVPHSSEHTQEPGAPTDAAGMASVDGVLACRNTNDGVMVTGPRSPELLRPPSLQYVPRRTESEESLVTAPQDSIYSVPMMPVSFTKPSSNTMLPDCQPLRAGATGNEQPGGSAPLLSGTAPTAAVAEPIPAAAAVAREETKGRSDWAQDPKLTQADVQPKAQEPANTAGIRPSQPPSCGARQWVEAASARRSVIAGDGSSQRGSLCTSVGIDPVQSGDTSADGDHARARMQDLERKVLELSEKVSTQDRELATLRKDAVSDAASPGNRALSLSASSLSSRGSRRSDRTPTSDLGPQVLGAGPSRCACGSSAEDPCQLWDQGLAGGGAGRCRRRISAEALRETVADEQPSADVKPRALRPAKAPLRPCTGAPRQLHSKQSSASPPAAELPQRGGGMRVIANVGNASSAPGRGARSWPVGGDGQPGKTMY